MQIFIKLPMGKTIALPASSDETINDVKNLIQDKEGFPPVMQRLLFEGEPLLDDGRTLGGYGIRADSTLDLRVQQGGDDKHRTTQVHIRCRDPALVIHTKVDMATDTVAGILADIENDLLSYQQHDRTHPCLRSLTPDVAEKLLKRNVGGGSAYELHRPASQEALDFFKPLSQIRPTPPPGTAIALELGREVIVPVSYFPYGSDMVNPTESVTLRFYVRIDNLKLRDIRTKIFRELGSVISETDDHRGLQYYLQLPPGQGDRKELNFASGKALGVTLQEAGFISGSSIALVGTTLPPVGAKPGAMQIYVKTLTGGRIYPIPSHTKVLTKGIKNVLHDREGIPPHQQRLFFDGIEMEDEHLAIEYGVEAEKTIILVLRIPPSGVFAPTGRLDFVVEIATGGLEKQEQNREEDGDGQLEEIFARNNE